MPRERMWHVMLTTRSNERLFGAVLGSDVSSGGGDGKNRDTAPIGSFRPSAEQPDPVNVLRSLLEHYNDPGKFDRMPIVVQSAVCDSAVALIRLAANEREVEAGRQFVERHGMTHH